ncbi:MAG: hypothetical protein JOY60_13380 [Burkholderiaceae bacterium]|nr:hypothetical protein [Roseateles sp.]MBV8470839.1 hypothetical protein [Burkholderiaceae bacterium]
MRAQTRRQLTSVLVVLAMVLAGFASVAHRFAPLSSASESWLLSICSESNSAAAPKPMDQAPGQAHAHDCAACVLGSIDFALPLPTALLAWAPDSRQAGSLAGFDVLQALAPLWQPSRSRAPPSSVISI